MDVNKANEDYFSDQKSCSKPQLNMSSSKIFKKSESGLYESSRTDSGFLSGANLLSDQNISSDDLSSPVSQKSVSDFDIKVNKSSDVYMRLDSGVDVSLNEQFSGLSLSKNNDLNDLNFSKSYNNTDISSVNNSFNVKPKPNEHEIPIIKQPWEIYYQQDNDGDTQLHIAIIQGFIEVVYSLIRMAPHPCFLDILNDVVQSPLHLAVLTHQARIVRQLIVCGASVERRDRHGNTALHLACQIGDLECVKALTEPITVTEVSDANLLYTGYTQQVPQDFEERNYDGLTCVHLAAYGEHIDVLRHLHWFGADLNARESKSGRTILHHAVETSSEILLHFLLDECPIGKNGGLVLDTLTYSGHTAYQLAAIMNRKLANELLERGASRRHGDDDCEDDEDGDDEHPDHNNCEESEDEMLELNNVYTNFGNYYRNGQLIV